MEEVMGVLFLLGAGSLAPQSQPCLRKDAAVCRPAACSLCILCAPYSIWSRSPCRGRTARVENQLDGCIFWQVEYFKLLAVSTVQ